MTEFSVVRSCDAVDDPEWSEDRVGRVFIPPEILLEIIQYLPFESLMSVSHVSRGFSEVYKCSSVWKKLMESEWKLLNTSETSPNSIEDTNSHDVQSLIELDSSSEYDSDYYELYKVGF